MFIFYEQDILSCLLEAVLKGMAGSLKFLHEVLCMLLAYIIYAYMSILLHFSQIETELLRFIMLFKIVKYCCYPSLL